MQKTEFEIILCMVCLFLWTGCQPSRNHRLLSSIDSTLTHNPTYAKKRLDSLRASVDGFSTKDRMYYHLLLTDAQNKLFIPLQDDSLMKSVADWYDTHGYDEERTRAWYLLASTYRDLNEYPLAIDYLLRAEESTQDFSMRWRITGQLCDCYDEAGFPQYALKKARQLVRFSMQHGTMNDVTQAYFNLGYTYLNFGDIKQSLSYFAQAQIWNQKQRNTTHFGETIQLHYILALFQNGQRRQAIPLLKKLPPLAPTSTLMPIYDLVLTFYYQDKRFPEDSIQKYTQQVLSAPYADLGIKATQNLYQYYLQKGLYAEANRILAQQMHLEKQSYMRRLESNARHIDFTHKYYLESKKTLHSQYVINGMLCVLFLALLTVAILYRYYARIRKEKERIFSDYKEKASKLQTYQTLIDSLNAQIEYYQSTQQTLQERISDLESQTTENYDGQITSLQMKNKELLQKIDAITKEKALLTEAKSKIQFSPDYKAICDAKLKNTAIYRKLSLYATKGRKMEEEDVEELSQTIQDIYPTFLYHLHTNFPRLAPQSMPLCLLLKCGFRTKDIASLLCVTHTSISHKKTRLYATAQNVPSDTKDLDDLVSSI